MKDDDKRRLAMRGRGPLGDKELAPIKSRLATIEKELAGYDALLQERRRLQSAYALLTGTAGVFGPGPQDDLPFDESHLTRALEHEEEMERTPVGISPVKALPPGARGSGENTAKALALECIKANPGCFMADIVAWVTKARPNVTRLGVASPVSAMLQAGIVHAEGPKGRLRYAMAGEPIPPVTYAQLAAGHELNRDLILRILEDADGKEMSAREILEEVRKYRPTHFVSNPLNALKRAGLIGSHGSVRNMRYFLKGKKTARTEEKTAGTTSGVSHLPKDGRLYDLILAYLQGHPGSLMRDIYADMVTIRPGTKRPHIHSALHTLLITRRIKAEGEHPPLRYALPDAGERQVELPADAAPATISDLVVAYVKEHPGARLKEIVEHVQTLRPESTRDTIGALIRRLVAKKGSRGKGPLRAKGDHNPSYFSLDDS